MTDGGHAMVDQSMPINGVHYGESELRDYPDEAYTCDKLFHQPQTIWKYDLTKPGFLGESLYTAAMRLILRRACRESRPFWAEVRIGKGRVAVGEDGHRGLPLGRLRRCPLLDDR